MLAFHLANTIPENASVLDVGCGDGLIDSLILQQRPDVTLHGVDVLVRTFTRIPVKQFDGYQLPEGEGSYDVVMFVDVLHHTNDPMVLLRDAARVARESIIIKDHKCNSFIDAAILRFMDWVGNERYGVALPYVYWSEHEWKCAFESLKLAIDIWKTNLNLYPQPTSLLLDRLLQFIAKLNIETQD